MTDFIDRETLATIATEAVSAMFRLELNPVDDVVDGAAMSRQSRSVVLRLVGTPEITLALACDDQAGAQLAGAMFDVSPQNASGAMIEDSLRELANILAGQVKSLMAPDHEIGLPRVQRDPSALRDRDWHGVTLRIGAGNQVLDLAVAA